MFYGQGYTAPIFDSSFNIVSSFPFQAFSKRAWAGELEMEGLEKCWRSFRRESHLILVEILQLEMRHKSALKAVKHGFRRKRISFDLSFQFCYQKKKGVFQWQMSHLATRSGGTEKTETQPQRVPSTTSLSVVPALRAGKRSISFRLTPLHLQRPISSGLSIQKGHPRMPFIVVGNSRIYTGFLES